MLFTKHTVRSHASTIPHSETALLFCLSGLNLLDLLAALLPLATLLPLPLSHCTSSTAQQRTMCAQVSTSRTSAQAQPAQPRETASLRDRERDRHYVYAKP